MLTTLITGISAGIGHALAAELLAQGHRVIGTTRSGKLPDLSHPELRVFPLTLPDQESIDALAKRLYTEGIQLDALINNAGTGPDLDALLPDRTSFQETFDVNVTGLVFLTEALLSMVRDGGQILHISSQMGLLSRAKPSAVAYRMSKAAVNMYAQVLSQRLQPRGIRVLAVHPGWVRTRMGGPAATMSVEASAQGISRLLQQTEPRTGFWNVETGEKVNYL